MIKVAGKGLAVWEDSLAKSPARRIRTSITFSGLLLAMAGDHMDDILERVLEPLGNAIRSSVGTIDDIERKFGSETAEMASEDEIPVIEELLGAAFVVCQANISVVASQLMKLHRHTQKRHAVNLTTTAGTKRQIMRYGFRARKAISFSKIEVINAFANYYKHRDEWDYDWSTLKGRQRQTATVIKHAGAVPHGNRDLRQGARYLGNPSFAKVSVFGDIFSRWRKKLLRDYEAECRRRKL